MGRDSKRIDTVNNCLQLKINVFVEYLKRGKIKGEFNIQWANGCNIKAVIISNKDYTRLELSYTKTWNNIEHDLMYHIYIKSVPSNLGKGNVYYFVCPLSGFTCRTLYLSQSSFKFGSYQSFKPKLYYPCQLSSKLDKHNDTFWRIDKVLGSLDSPYTKRSYRGNPTKKAQRIARLEVKQQFHEKMRWIIIPKALQKRGGI